MELISAFNTRAASDALLSLSAEKVPVIGARKGTSCSTEGRSSPF